MAPGDQLLTVATESAYEINIHDPEFAEYNALTEEKEKYFLPVALERMVSDRQDESTMDSSESSNRRHNDIENHGLLPKNQ